MPLYDPGQMKEFADKSAPGLFNVILQFILQEDPRLSEEHRVLEENRTVVLLHIHVRAYCFFKLDVFKIQVSLKDHKVTQFSKSVYYN